MPFDRDSEQIHGEDSSRRPSALRSTALSRMNSGEAIMLRVRGRASETVISKATWPGRGVRTSDAIGQEDGLLDIVRHEKNGGALLLPDPSQPGLQLGASEGIERSEGLVEENELFVRQDGPQKRYALPHAAGKLGWISIAKSSESEALDSSALADCRACDLDSPDASRPRAALSIVVRQGRRRSRCCM